MPVSVFGLPFTSSLLVNMPSSIKHRYSGTIYSAPFDTFLPQHHLNPKSFTCLSTELIMVWLTCMRQVTRKIMKCCSAFAYNYNLGGFHCFLNFVHFCQAGFHCSLNFVHTPQAFHCYLILYTFPKQFHCSLNFVHSSKQSLTVLLILYTFPKQGFIVLLILFALI